jgi:hypothetical protein
MKLKVKGCRFQDVTEIQEQSLTSYTRFQKVSSRGASSSGKNAGPVAYTRKGNILKGTATSNTKGKRVFRYWLSPETYGYIPVWEVKNLRDDRDLYKRAIYELSKKDSWEPQKTLEFRTLYFLNTKRDFYRWNNKLCDLHKYFSKSQIPTRAAIVQSV